MKTRYRFTLELGQAEISEPTGATFATRGDIAIDEEGTLRAKHIENFLVEVSISPETREPRNEEWGRLYITVSGSPEEHWLFAERLAEQIADHLSLYYDGLRVIWGMVFAERIPETDEERSALGDNLYSARANIVQARPKVQMLKDHLVTFPQSANMGRVIRQFAAARSAVNPIDAYLGMFKVIETLFHRGRGQAREVLINSADFRRHVSSLRAPDAPPTENEIQELVDAFVKARNNCAHLREHNAFGFAPGDPEVRHDVTPLYDLLSEIAFAAIDARITESQSQAG